MIRGPWGAPGVAACLAPAREVGPIHRIEQWLIGHTWELSATGIDVPAMRAQSHEIGPGLRTAGARMLDDWLELLTW
jgi:hypothetical protein